MASRLFGWTVILAGLLGVALPVAIILCRIVASVVVGLWIAALGYGDPWPLASEILGVGGA